MRRVVVVLCILCTLGVFASAQVSQEVERALAGVTVLAPGLGLVTDKGCGGTYHAGSSTTKPDLISISVTPEIGGYLYLLDFSPDGKTVMLLFPCRYFWKDFPVTVKASTKTTIPPEGAWLQLYITAPFGKEVLFGFVVPDERADLVKLFDANNPDSFSVLHAQEDFATSLVASLVALAGSGAKFVAGICTFYPAPPGSP
jgi:hypothetical protein